MTAQSLKKPINAVTTSKDQVEATRSTLETMNHAADRAIAWLASAHRRLELRN